MGEERAGEDLETRRKRLIFRSCYTGTKETDMLPGPFARRYLPSFSPAQLDAYEALLDCNEDPQIFAWATGKSTVPAAFEGDVMTLLQNFKISDQSFEIT